MKGRNLVSMLLIALLVFGLMWAYQPLLVFGLMWAYQPLDIEELPGEFEEYESEYFSIDLPEGWVKHGFAMPSPGEFYLECYPSEHNKNPDIELHIWNSSIEDLDEFVMYVEGVDEFPTYQDCRIAGTAGKKAMRTDSKYEYITFYFPVKTERYGLDVRYYYCRLMFRRELSTFDDVAWNNFVERVAGSLELEN